MITDVDPNSLVLNHQPQTVLSQVASTTTRRYLQAMPSISFQRKIINILWVTVVVMIRELEFLYYESLDFSLLFFCCRVFWLDYLHKSWRSMVVRWVKDGWGGSRSIITLKKIKLCDSTLSLRSQSIRKHLILYDLVCSTGTRW